MHLVQDRHFVTPLVGKAKEFDLLVELRVRLRARILGNENGTSTNDIRSLERIVLIVLLFQQIIWVLV